MLNACSRHRLCRVLAGTEFIGVRCFPVCFFIQISHRWCLCNEIVSDWRENLYTKKAAELILYGRALGLSHGEAEDVLQETFLALLQKPEPPVTLEHYCVRSFRNHARNYRRSWWRGLSAGEDARRW